VIDQIYVSALKSIQDLSIQCSNLNLFVGTNSSGKSTFLQAMLLLAQKELNGKYISIGDFREVRNYYMANEAIRIEVREKGKNKPVWIEFKEDKENDSYEVNTIYNSEEFRTADFDDQQSLFGISAENIHYISCHRVGAADIYAKNLLNESDFGIDGEYALAYLLENEIMPINKELVVNEGKSTNSLLDQVNYWLDYIVGTTLKINDLKKTNYLQVKYNNNPANESSDALYCRPVNVGSGISYLISIIIACLGSNDGATIIIENPEIHLHPKAQSKLSEFLYFVSKSNRQLFIETHSDHIFNFLRAGIATGKVLDNAISINFFAMNAKYETQCNPIIIKEYGKIIGTNEEMDIVDLFDQFELDLDKMLGL